MNREKAEKLLTALLFDDLDASSKEELTAYLQTDDELRERLADMRMAVKVTSDALQSEPKRTLDQKRLKKLAQLAEKSNSRSVVYTFRYIATAAAVLAAIALPAYLFMPSLKKASSPVSAQLAIDLSDSDSADWNRSHGIEFAGSTSTTYEIDSEDMGYKRSAEQSAEGERQVAQVFDFEDPYSDDITGGVAMGSNITREISGTRGGRGGGMGMGGMGGGGIGGGTGGRGGMGGPSISVQAGSNPYLIGGDGGHGGDGGNSGLSVGGGIYTYNDTGDSGTVLGWNSADNKHESSLVDSSAPADRYFPSDPTSVASGNESYIAANPSEPSGSPGIAGRESRGVTIDSINDATMSYYNRYQNSPVVVGQSAPGREVEGLDAPASVIGIDSEPSKQLNSRDFTFKDGKASDLWEDQAAITTSTRRPAPRPAPVTAPPPAVQSKPNRIVTRTGTTVASPETPISGKPAAPTETAPVSGGWGGVIGNALEHAPQVKVQAELVEIPQSLQDQLNGDIIAAGEKYNSELSLREGTEISNEEFESRTKGVIDENGDVIEEGKVKAPLIGDLPILGTLFKNESTKDIATKEDAKKEIEAGELNRKAREISEAKEKKLSLSDEINYPQNWEEIAQAGQEFLKEDGYLELSAEDISNLPAASRFKSVPVNPWVMTQRDALSTFALDVDTASYALSRRYISSGYLPPAGAVRMEEFINYFNYQYPQQPDRTFKVHAEAAASPFAGAGKNLTLLKIGVKARTLGRDQFKPAHLVFVIDTSASMGQPDRLPLIQQALNMLLDSLTPADRVTLISCSDQAHLLLDAMPVSQSDRIRQVIDAVQPSGTTNLLAGLQLGYATARRAYSARQINQIVLCSDGVANVGQTEAEAVLNAVAEDRKQGITMTCVGVGYGTYNDAFMESLADQGDGSYVFLDSLRQAQRVFVEQLAATLHTVAKDARIQVSFNPERVRRYRLIGYENRDIEDARFRDDTIDAGEVGSGQCSTALYELEMINSPSASQFDDFGTVFVRYRNVDTAQFEEISCDLENSMVRTRTVENSPYFYLAAAVAHYAEILRQSEHVQGSSLRDVQVVADKLSSVLGLDRDVRELAELIRRSENLPEAQ